MVVIGARGLSAVNKSFVHANTSAKLLSSAVRAPGQQQGAEKSTQHRFFHPLFPRTADHSPSLPKLSAVPGKPLMQRTTSALWSPGRYGNVCKRDGQPRASRVHSAEDSRRKLTPIALFGGSVSS